MNSSFDSFFSEQSKLSISLLLNSLSRLSVTQLKKGSITLDDLNQTLLLLDPYLSKSNQNFYVQLLIKSCFDSISSHLFIMNSNIIGDDTLFLQSIYQQLVSYTNGNEDLYSKNILEFKKEMDSFLKIQQSNQPHCQVSSSSESDLDPNPFQLYSATSFNSVASSLSTSTPFPMLPESTNKSSPEDLNLFSTDLTTSQFAQLWLNNPQKSNFDTPSNSSVCSSSTEKTSNQPLPPTISRVELEKSEPMIKLLANVRKIGMDLLNSETHDYVLASILVAIRFSKNPAHRELIDLVMLIKEKEILPDLDNVSKTKVRGILALLKHSEVLSTQGLEGEPVRLTLNSDVTTFGELRQKHDKFLDSYIHEHHLFVPTVLKSEILWLIQDEALAKKLEEMDEVIRKLEEFYKGVELVPYNGAFVLASSIEVPSTTPTSQSGIAMKPAKAAALNGAVRSASITSVASVASNATTVSNSSVQDVPSMINIPSINMNLPVTGSSLGNMHSNNMNFTNPAGKPGFSLAKSFNIPEISIPNQQLFGMGHNNGYNNMTPTYSNSTTPSSANSSANGTPTSLSNNYDLRRGSGSYYSNASPSYSQRPLDPREMQYSQSHVSQGHYPDQRLPHRSAVNPPVDHYQQQYLPPPSPSHGYGSSRPGMNKQPMQGNYPCPSPSHYRGVSNNQMNNNRYGNNSAAGTPRGGNNLNNQGGYPNNGTNYHYPQDNYNNAYRANNNNGNTNSYPTNTYANPNPPMGLNKFNLGVNLKPISTGYAASPYSMDSPREEYSRNTANSLYKPNEYLALNNHLQLATNEEDPYFNLERSRPNQPSSTRGLGKPPSPQYHYPQATFENSNINNSGGNNSSLSRIFSESNDFSLHHSSSSRSDHNGHYLYDQSEFSSFSTDHSMTTKSASMSQLGSSSSVLNSSYNGSNLSFGSSVDRYMPAFSIDAIEGLKPSYDLDSSQCGTDDVIAPLSRGSTLNSIEGLSRSNSLNVDTGFGLTKGFSQLHQASFFVPAPPTPRGMNKTTVNHNGIAGSIQASNANQPPPHPTNYHSSLKSNGVAINQSQYSIDDLIGSYDPHLSMSGSSLIDDLHLSVDTLDL